MDAARLLVTVLGTALIVAVNVYFFARPRAPRPGVKSAAAAADEPGQPRGPRA